MERVNNYTAQVIEAAQAAGVPHGWTLVVTRRSQISFFRTARVGEHGPDDERDQCFLEMFYTGGSNTETWRMAHGPREAPNNKPENLGWSSWWDSLSQVLIDVAACFDEPPLKPTYANGPGLKSDAGAGSLSSQGDDVERAGEG